MGPAAVSAMPSPREPSRAITSRSTMDFRSPAISDASRSDNRGRMNRCLSVLRPPSFVLRYRQPVKPADEQRGERRNSSGESDPNADCPEAARESQSVGAGEADEPKAHRGKQHGHTGVVKPAQCT